MKNDFITVVQFEGMHDANLSYVCMQLDEKNIPYYLMDELSSTVLNYLPTNIMSVKLRVQESNVEEVVNILNSIPANNNTPEVPMDAEDAAWLKERENEKVRLYEQLIQGLKWGGIILGIVLFVYLFIHRSSDANILGSRLRSHILYCYQVYTENSYLGK